MLIKQEEIYYDFLCYELHVCCDHSSSQQILIECPQDAREIAGDEGATQAKCPWAGTPVLCCIQGPSHGWPLTGLHKHVLKEGGSGWATNRVTQLYPAAPIQTLNVKGSDPPAPDVFVRGGSTGSHTAVSKKKNGFTRFLCPLSFPSY